MASGSVPLSACEKTTPTLTRPTSPGGRAAVREPDLLVAAVAQRLAVGLPATAQRHAVASLEPAVPGRRGDAAGDPQRPVVDDGDGPREERFDRRVGVELVRE